MHVIHTKWMCVLWLLAFILSERKVCCEVAVTGCHDVCMLRLRDCFVQRLSLVIQ